MDIHDRLRSMIEDEGMSISKFERIVEVGQNTVSTCRRRESTISHTVLQGICKHFPNQSIEWILTGKESNNEKVKKNIERLMKQIEAELKNISH